MLDVWWCLSCVIVALWCKVFVVCAEYCVEFSVFVRSTKLVRSCCDVSGMQLAAVLGCNIV
jgi:hypothetical protein